MQCRTVFRSVFRILFRIVFCNNILLQISFCFINEHVVTVVVSCRGDVGDVRRPPRPVCAASVDLAPLSAPGGHRKGAGRGRRTAGEQR